jgi:hypothetical protein
MPHSVRFTSRGAGTWVADSDSEDSFVIWVPGRNTEPSSEDESMAVYLPKGKKLRARAARVIAKALARAGIPGPIRRRGET